MGIFLDLQHTGIILFRNNLGEVKMGGYKLCFKQRHMNSAIRQIFTLHLHFHTEYVNSWIFWIIHDRALLSIMINSENEMDDIGSAGFGGNGGRVNDTNYFQAKVIDIHQDISPLAN